MEENSAYSSESRCARLLNPTNISFEKVLRERVFRRLINISYLFFVAILSLVAAQRAEARIDTTEFEHCFQLLRTKPDAHDGPHCFYLIARRQDRWEEALQHLEQLLHKYPENARIQLALGHTVTSSNPPRAESLFRDAIEAFVSTADLRGELRGRDALWTLLKGQHRFPEAAEQLEAAEAAVVRTNDPHLQARVMLLRARHWTATNSNLSAAYDLLTECRSVLFPDGPYQLRVKWLDTRAFAAFQLGRAKEATASYAALAKLEAQWGDVYAEARSLQNSLLSLRDTLDSSSDPEDRRRATILAEETLRKANATGNHRAKFLALTTLAVLLRDERSRSLYKQCVTEAQRLGKTEELRECKLSLAEDIARNSPNAGIDLLNEALAIESIYDDAEQSIYDLHKELHVLWPAGLRESAYEVSLKVLDQIEDLRDAQSDPSGRAGLFAGWSATYPWTIGWLFVGYEESSKAVELERGFEVTERMRSRVLLDTLDAADVTTQETPELGAKREERSSLLQQVTSIQRELRRQDLTSAAREGLLVKLDTLEAQEGRLQREIARLNPRFAQLERPDFATIERVRDALLPNEALLSFVTAPWESVFESFAGGSWVVVITRDQAKLYRLPGADKLRASVPMFSGFFETQGDAPEAASVRLYDDLLRAAIDELPAAVDSLILVPDGPLLRLPFAALRPAADAPPLAARFQLSRIPSATLWLQWRENTPGPAALPALAFADPDLGTQGEEPEIADATVRAWDPLRGTNLGPLPFARREGWSLRRRLGNATRLLVGAEATEKTVKSEILERYGLIHFAAHATPDSDSPERSTVHLAAGDPREDGWLQFREIAELRLGGRPVVLSTCHSAAGKILRGEGVLDLARAFFQGGAHAVVASLWKIEDRATAEFFDIFYRHIAAGATLSAAHQRAQRELIEAGAPASAWAGIVVLGNGEITPVPNPPWRFPTEGLLLASLGLLAAAGTVARRRLSSREGRAAEP